MNDEKWFALHTAYLKTPAWKARRAAVLERAGRVCEARLPACDGTATQAHHLSYRHWRYEPLFDLVAVCESCHTEITRMDRGLPAEELLREQEELQRARQVEAIISEQRLDRQRKQAALANLKALMDGNHPQHKTDWPESFYAQLREEIARVEAELVSEHSVPAGGATRDEDHDDRT